MSGRIRTIKPEILENARTAGLPHDSWRLFVSLFLLADDYGNMYGAPERIAGSVFWAQPSRDTREALGVLCNAGLIAFYELRGQIYLSIIGWIEHQKIDKPSKPRVPGPQSQGCLVLKELPRDTFATYSRDTRETLAPDLDQDLDLRSGSTTQPDSSNPGAVEPLEQLELESPEPTKPTGKPESAELVSHYAQAWVATQKPADGKPPELSKADRGQASQLVRKYGLEACKGYVDRYLADPDPWLAKTGYALAHLASRIGGYRSRSGSTTGHAKAAPHNTQSRIRDDF